MPMAVVDVPIFEENNGICINVFQYSDETETGVKIIYISDKKYSKIVNLLVIEENDKRHYILIKSLETLLRSRTKMTGKFIHVTNVCVVFTQNELFKSMNIIARLENHKLKCQMIL